MSEAIELLAELADGFAVQGVVWTDFQGPLGETIRAWQAEGFISNSPSPHPCPACPYCEDGMPEELFVDPRCKVCFSRIDERDLHWWPFDRRAFLQWLSSHWSLIGSVRQVDAYLWQLGTAKVRRGTFEIFFRGSGSLTPAALGRLNAYQSALVVSPASIPSEPDRPGHIVRSLLQAFHEESGLWRPLDLASWLGEGEKSIRYEHESGTIWTGDRPFGSVPVGDRESHLLAILAERSPEFVTYAEIKRGVLLRSGGRDTRDESTFCHRLKNRLKRFIPDVDEVIDSTRSGAGYRLRNKL